ncbi:MAG: hypothetical protein JWO72_847 [Caulobacteraceae bacterium]|jgi:uncharacterized membrane protein SirB2|nr:hypothetical protein [Caulobacteraceae bacterium]
MLAEVAKFCDWLSLTPISMLFQTVEWIIPAVQSVHILAIAIVMSSVIMVDLRLMGLMGHSQSISGMTRRFIPWVWWSLVVLLLTGLILITAEPRRDLLNPVFQAKMVLLVVAIVVTAVFQEIVRRNMEFWDLSPSRRAGALATAVLSLLVWTAIVGCGRWIAYVEHG